MPMMRRRPVLRTVGRTAVIAGTATVVAGGVNRHQQQKAAAQQQAAAPAGRSGPGGAGRGRAELRRPDQQVEGAGQPEGPGDPDRGRVQRSEGEDPGGDVLSPRDHAPAEAGCSASSGTFGVPLFASRGVSGDRDAARPHRAGRAAASRTEGCATGSGSCGGGATWRGAGPPGSPPAAGGPGRPGSGRGMARSRPRPGSARFGTTQRKGSLDPQADRRRLARAVTLAQPSRGGRRPTRRRVVPRRRPSRPGARGCR